MAKKVKGKIKLPYDLELNDETTTLVVAYPRYFYRGIYGDKWGKFLRSLVRHIQESPESSLKTPEALVESAYERAATFTDDEFSLGRVNHGYYFPKSRKASTMGAEYEISRGVNTSYKNLLFEYPSEMTTASGGKVTVQKTYFGRAKELFPDGTAAIWIDGRERRTFILEKISAIDVVISTSGEMRYTTLRFSKSKGNSYLEWDQISSRDKVLKTTPDAARSVSSGERTLHKFEGLAHLKGVLVKVHYRQGNQELTMAMKLVTYRYTATNDRLTLMGENGITLTGFRESFKLEKLI